MQHRSLKTADAAVFRPNTAFRAPKCSAGHQLFICMCPVGAQICDRCEKPIQYTYSHRCRECDFDLCLRCFSSASRVPRSARGPRPPGAPMEAGAAGRTDNAGERVASAPAQARSTSFHRRRKRQMRGVYSGFVLQPGFSHFGALGGLGALGGSGLGLTELSPRRLASDPEEDLFEDLREEAAAANALRTESPKSPQLLSSEEASLATPTPPRASSSRAASSRAASPAVASPQETSMQNASARGAASTQDARGSLQGQAHTSVPPAVPLATELRGLPAEERCRVATAVMVARTMAHPTMPQQRVRGPVLRPGTCLADYPSRAVYTRSQW